MSHEPSPFDAARLTRRELLCRSGMGFGAMALGSLLTETGFLGATARAADQTGGSSKSSAVGSVNPLLPKLPPLPGAREAGGPPVHERRTVACGHVRPQADAHEVPRQAGADELAHRAQDRRGVSLTLHVQEVWTERHRGQRDLRPHRGDDRRHLRRPVDARRRAQPRAVAHADELRRGPTGPAQPWVLGALRPGCGEPEPARLPGHVPRRLPDRRVAELAVGVPARDLPGNLRRSQEHRYREADRPHSQPRRQSPDAAGPA